MRHHEGAERETGEHQRDIGLARLRVGPESAGSSPGPACYGRGGELPTVTDANLVLGILDANVALGGEIALDLDGAKADFAAVLEIAEAAARQHPSVLVLGADTTVVVDSEILGKPQDETEARKMLRLLRGRWHDVLTGVALVRTEGNSCRVVAHERTQVRFGQMSDAEIDWYVRSGEPMDKAGAYAVQGRAALFIEEIRGDYWNVVGLPIRLVYKLAGEV